MRDPRGMSQEGELRFLTQVLEMFPNYDIRWHIYGRLDWLQSELSLTELLSFGWGLWRGDWYFRFPGLAVVIRLHFEKRVENQSLIKASLAIPTPHSNVSTGVEHWYEGIEDALRSGCSIFQLKFSKYKQCWALLALDFCCCISSILVTAATK